MAFLSVGVDAWDVAQTFTKGSYKEALKEVKEIFLEAGEGSCKDYTKLICIFATTFLSVLIYVTVSAAFYLVPVYPVVICINFFKWLPSLLGTYNATWKTCACNWGNLKKSPKRLPVYLDHVLLLSVPEGFMLGELDGDDEKVRECSKWRCCFGIYALKETCCRRATLAQRLELSFNFWMKFEKFEETIDALFALLDLDESGAIDKDEFEELIKCLKSIDSSQGRFKEVIESKTFKFDDAYRREKFDQEKEKWEKVWDEER